MYIYIYIDGIVPHILILSLSSARPFIRPKYACARVRMPRRRDARVDSGGLLPVVGVDDDAARHTKTVAYVVTTDRHHALSRRLVRRLFRILLL